MRCRLFIEVEVQHRVAPRQAKAQQSIKITRKLVFSGYLSMY